MGGPMRVRGWRKISLASWGPPVDPQIYGDLEIDAGELQAYRNEARRRTGVQVTITHLIGRAIAHALAAHPDLNVRLSRGSLVPRGQADIFFIATTGGGRDLSGVKVERAEHKSVVEVAGEVIARTARLRSGDDAELGQAKALLDSLPTWLLRRLLRVLGWLTVDRNLDLGPLGMPRQTFGSAMVSSVGMFGIRKAYAPLAPYYKVPILILVGEVKSTPVAVAGHVEVRPIVTLSVTLDHRYLDAFQAAQLAASLKAYCAAPGDFEPPLPALTHHRPERRTPPAS